MAKNRRPYVEALPKRFQKIRNLLNRPWSFLFGAIACAFLLAMILLLKPIVIKWRVEQETLFTKGTETYRKLVNITVPIYFKIRVFNITNPDALEKREKFKLQELGPYVYEEKRIKNVSKENLEEGTITFKEIKIFKFRPDLSNGRVEMHPAYDVFTELNPKGYHRQFTGGHFAYFNQENSTDTGEFEYFSGVKGSERFGQILSWNGEKELSFWTNNSLPADQQFCNKLNGSDGIPGWQFRIANNALQSPSKNPDNQCFCQDPGGGLEKECIDGLYRAFNCYHDAPMVISKPHFLDGAQSLLDGVEGLNPRRDVHDSMYSIEPVSGMFLTCSVKFQLSAEIQPYPGVIDDLPHVFVPLLWVEQNSSLDQAHSDFIMWMKVIPLRIIAWIEWALAILAGLMLAYAIYMTTRKTPRKSELRGVELEPISVTTTASKVENNTLHFLSYRIESFGGTCKEQTLKILVKLFLKKLRAPFVLFGLLLLLMAGVRKHLRDRVFVSFSFCHFNKRSTKSLVRHTYEFIMDIDLIL
ncbi:unnamed protein product [Allacma fusca]|uniref:Uncharacterized protein n=1 Tax=Allacma fusca TaxID=39272 RepID=A0A8J2PJZ2_9HEXA|nr:unnamed protein product [Allacma fusca]